MEIVQREAELLFVTLNRIGSPLPNGIENPSLAPFPYPNDRQNLVELLTRMCRTVKCDLSYHRRTILALAACIEFDQLVPDVIRLRNVPCFLIQPAEGRVAAG